MSGFRALKNHPFGVEAFFDYTAVLTFAVPADELEPLIPACLQLDTFQGKWGFVAVAMVQTRGLRPQGFPKWTGQDFFLIGYRIFVRYNSRSGRRLRGLYILKSETNRRRMQLLGSIFTQYDYETVDIEADYQPGELQVQSDASDLDVHLTWKETVSSSTCCISIR